MENDKLATSPELDAANTVLNLDELRTIAEGADPGPWFVELVGEHGAKRSIIADVLREKYGRNALDFGEDHAMAAYVAAFDPPTILALLKMVSAR